MREQAGLRESIRGMSRELEEGLGEALQRFPIQGYLHAIREFPRLESYFGLSSVVRQWCEAIESACGAHVRALYQKLAILKLMEGSLEVLLRGEFPGSVTAVCLDHYRRMVSELASHEDRYYNHRNEALIDDVCCSSLKTIPIGGAWMIETAAVRKRLFVAGGIRQFLACVAVLLIKTRGLAPFYQIHTLKRYRGGFDPVERMKCYQRIADLLKQKPEIRGVYLLGWLYDPKLAAISPELAYLREVPEREGARRFRLGPTEQAIRFATAWSAERRRLYEEGKYTPTEYALIWPRKEILRWAMRGSHGQAAREARAADSG